MASWHSATTRADRRTAVAHAGGCSTPMPQPAFRYHTQRSQYRNCLKTGCFDNVSESGGIAHCVDLLQ